MEISAKYTFKTLGKFWFIVLVKAYINYELLLHYLRVSQKKKNREKVVFDFTEVIKRRNFQC